MKSGVVPGIQWICGALSKADAPDRRPLYRSYNGVKKCVYAVDAPVNELDLATPEAEGVSASDFVNAGVMGYLWKKKHKGMTPLYRTCLRWQGVDRWHLGDDPPSGFMSKTLLGCFIDLNGMVGNSAERSDF